MKRYTGTRSGSAVDVTVNGRPLNPRFDLWKHSPTGFEWGYNGSGPAQLALALVADCLNNDEIALKWYQAFKDEMVIGLPYRGWTMTEEEVWLTVDALKSQPKEA